MSAISKPAAGPLEAGDLLDERKAAAILDVSLSTLRNWRWRGNQGPHYRKIGARLVRYHRDDLMAFVQGQGGDHARA